MRRLGNFGFTMIELLLAITLLAMLVATIAESFGLTLTVFEAAGKRVEERYGFDESISLIRDKISGSMAVMRVNEEGAATYAFEGHDSAIWFVTDTPRLLDAGVAKGLYLQSIQMDNKNSGLLFTEARFIPDLPFDEHKMKPLLLAKGLVNNIHVSYTVEKRGVDGRIEAEVVGLLNVGELQGIGNIPVQVQMKLDIKTDDEFKLPMLTIPIFAGRTIRRQE